MVLRNLLHPEDEGRKLLQNVRVYLPNYTASHPRSATSQKRRSLKTITISAEI
jgi:hypothetical protein